MSYQQTGMPRESVPQNDQGDGKTNVRQCNSRDEEFAAVAGRIIVSSAATTSLAEGCQRIHREGGEVCDIFIPD